LSAENAVKHQFVAIAVMLMAGALAAQGLSTLPQIDPIIATMKGAPRKGTGLALLAGVDPQSASIAWVRASYQCKGVGAPVEVYASADARNMSFGRPNVAGLADANGASALRGSSFGYALLGGKPCYLQTRRNGSWFLFVVPDDAALDVAGFILRFNDCYGFFESRLPGAGPSDCFPAFVGVLQGVR
jgi:hypothetical protein